MSDIARIVSCIDGYDPDALHVEKARAAIRACLAPIAVSELVPLRTALGRVLAQDIVPSIDVPGHDNSAMDGYAVRSADLKSDAECVLEEIGTALAGRAYQGSVGAGQCVRVMTGAVLPSGADTIVIQEIVRIDGKRIAIPPGQKPKQNVRYAGEDLKAGVAVLKSGTLVGPAELGVISSLGIARISVRRRLRVVFFSTGDELSSVGTPLAQGQIYDSNRYTLRGMLSRLGVELLDFGIVRDDPAELEHALRSASLSADAIVTSGGVSVGEADFVRRLMGELGEVLVWKIAMRPGRPMAFGRIGNAFLFGLPGNPVAVMVTFSQFVREALLVLAGRSGDLAPASFRVPSAAAMRKIPGRTEYQRGILFRENGEWRVRTTGQQGSGVLRSMAEANCFIVLEHERGAIAAGDPVSVQPFDGLV
ncbi:MAG TPA: gephyrin-like molybdotransferase Glp [Burkholderiales bacterium]|nr:gephyrin-like molybdotransferase Glp [Burkholderiales bacterium]